MNEAKKTIKEVLVVEGKNDTNHLKDFFNVETIETNGLGLNKETLHFENKEELTEQEEIYRERRRILFDAMSSAGFTNNPTKWFHWDYGNLWWAELKGEKAFYGAIDQ